MLSKAMKSSWEAKSTPAKGSFSFSLYVSALFISYYDTSVLQTMHLEDENILLKH